MSEGSRRAAVARRRSRGRLGLLAQLLVLIALVVLGLHLLDVESIRLAFRGVAFGNLAGFLVLMLATRVAMAWRWQIVARDHLGLEAVSLGFLLRAGLLAEFANLWLQSFIGGEAVRVWKVAQRTGQRKLAVGSVVLDRFVGTVSLVAVCLPLALPLGARLPKAGLSPGTWRAVIAAAVALALAAAIGLRLVPMLRNLLRRSFDFLGRQRFLGVPFAVSLLVFPLMVLAHRVGFPELAERSWLVVAMIALLPRLGRAVPLSLFGVSAVEGSVLVIGALLDVSTETLVVIVALNLLAKYVASGLGALSELAAEGGHFFREIRRAVPAGEEELVASAVGADDGEPRP